MTRLLCVVPGVHSRPTRVILSDAIAHHYYAALANVSTNQLRVAQTVIRPRVGGNAV
jgi:hypothetical protein